MLSKFLINFVKDTTSLTGEHAGQPDAESLHAFLSGPEGLTKLDSTFTRKEVVEAVAERVGASCTAGDVERLVDGFLASGQAHGLDPDGPAHEWVWRRGGNKERDVDLARWSTPELLRLEADLNRWAADGLGTPPAAANPVTVEAVISARPSLSQEQATMVRRLSTPGVVGLQPVSGRPGSGKTYATATYVRALVDDGIPVVGCALAATAAAELERSCQFGALTGREASTVARLLRQLDHEPLPSGAVVVVDEASMLGTRDLHRLASHTRKVGGSVKLIGDPKQHGAVETGGFFKHLCDQAGVGLISLEDNNRQTGAEDRHGVEEFRQGLVEAALARYDTNGHVHRATNAPAAYDLMATHWADTVTGGGTDPMIAGPNRVRGELNRRARNHMATAGRLSGPTLTTETGIEIQAGDWIVTRRNQPHLRSPEGGWVKNGSAGTVTNVNVESREVTVDFDREGQIILPAAYVDGVGCVEHGYARTTYGVQGATLERALYFAGDEASFEEGYVAFTRGRTETRLYLVDGTAATDEDTAHKAHSTKPTGLDTVAAALGRERANPLAHDADPYAANVHTNYQGWTLDRLRVERTRIETVLTAGPKDVTEDHTEATEQRDQTLARRRAHSNRTDPTGTREVERLDGDLARLDARIERLETGLAERAAYLAGHPAEVAAYPLVRRAELARDLQVRAQAAITPPARLTATLGQPPEDAIARRAWTDAAELVAVHTERYGTTEPTPQGDTPEQVLGARPQSFAAALSWDRAAEATKAAEAMADRTPEVAPDRGAETQPELLSLVD